MSKSSTIKSSTSLLFVFVVSVALVASDLVVFAQNSNSSTTQDDQTRGGQMTSNGNMQNTNTGRTGNRRRRRRGTRNTATTNTSNTGDMGNMSGDMGGNTSMQDNTNTGDMTGTTNTNTGGRRRRRRGGGAATTTAVMTTTTPATESEQTDLSGTYTGSLQCSSVGGVGEGTLTITGNQFTWTPAGGGAAATGRVVGVTTRGYTAVAMQFGESVAPPPGQPATRPIIVSLRARRSGDRLTLTPVAQGLQDCSFTSAGAPTTGGRRRRRRGMGGMNMN